MTDAERIKSLREGLEAILAIADSAYLSPVHKYQLMRARAWDDLGRDERAGEPNHPSGLGRALLPGDDS